MSLLLILVVLPTSSEAFLAFLQGFASCTSCNPSGPSIHTGANSVASFGENVQDDGFSEYSSS